MLESNMLKCVCDMKASGGLCDHKIMIYNVSLNGIPYNIRSTLGVEERI